MKNLDDILNDIVENGVIMSPETVKLKSFELNREFNKFKKEVIKEHEIEELDQNDELTIYQSWVGHKLAVYDLTLGKILDCINGE